MADSPFDPFSTVTDAMQRRLGSGSQQARGGAASAAKLRSVQDAAYRRLEEQRLREQQAGGLYSGGYGAPDAGGSGYSGGVSGAGQRTGPGTAWGGWKLGAVPDHHGWAGLTADTKEWVLRTLGQFPELRFTSGYRSPAYNATIPGAAKNSGHTRGVKADFAVTGWRPQDYQPVVDWLKQFGARTLVHDGGTGLHLDVSFDGLGR